MLIYSLLCVVQEKRENTILCLNEQWNEERRNKNDDDGWEDAEEEDKIFLYFFRWTVLYKQPH